MCRTHLSHFQFVANMNVYEHIGHISWDKCDPRQMCPYIDGFDKQAPFPLIPSLNSILFSSAHWNSRLGQTLSFIWKPFAAQHGMARKCLIECSRYTAVWILLWMYKLVSCPFNIIKCWVLLNPGLQGDDGSMHFHYCPWTGSVKRYSIFEDCSARQLCYYMYWHV